MILRNKKILFMTKQLSPNSFVIFFSHVGSISSTFYGQLLRSQIPNEQKKTSSWLYCLALKGPTSVKAARKMLMKLTPGVNFINVLHFTKVQKRQSTCQSFCAFGICRHKSCLYQIDEIDTWSQFRNTLREPFFVQKCFLFLQFGFVILWQRNIVNFF